MLVVPRWVQQVMLLHAQDEAPLECCGLLAGVSDPGDSQRHVVQSIYPLENEARSPTRYFAASGLFAPFKQIRAEGQELLAIYHSHPETLALPSQTDLSSNYYPEVLHAIVSLAGPTPQLRLFELTPSSYVERPFLGSDQPADDEDWLKLAVQLSRRCPKKQTSYAVGAVIVGPDGELASMGYSLELGEAFHAEHVALEKAHKAGKDVQGGTIYSTMEPCSVRASGKTPCVQRIVDAGLDRVVFALEEPPVFVRCQGKQQLADRGLKVSHLPEWAPLVEAVNRHVLEQDLPT